MHFYVWQRDSGEKEEVAASRKKNLCNYLLYVFIFRHFVGVELEKQWASVREKRANDETYLFGYHLKFTFCIGLWPMEGLKAVGTAMCSTLL